MILKLQIKEAIRITHQVIGAVISNPDLYEFKVQNSRNYGEIVMHIIRSLEYYLRGVVTDTWEFLKYNISDYNTPLKLMRLFKEVEINLDRYINDLKSDIIHQKFDSQNAFGLNLIIEMLHHHSHHIGQLSMYQRLNDVKPEEMKYFI